MGGTVLYDGQCRLCISQVRFITDRAGVERFHPLPIQSEEGKRLLRAAGLSDTEIDTVVYSRNGRYLTRSSAVLHILKDLGGRWQLMYILIIIPAFIRDFFYSLVARNRHRFAAGKGQ